jgi:hypothetical protein
MPYTITTKDGITINNIPDNVDPQSQELKDRVAKIRADNQMPAIELEQKPLTAGEVATGAVMNFPRSFANLVGNIVTAVTNPLETGKSILDVGAGALQNVLPEKFVQFVGEDKQSREMARKVGQFYADRYGTGEGLKKAVAEDPAGVLADLSTVLTGGAAAAPRAVAQPLARAASTIDPLAATVRGTGAVTGAVGRNILSPYLGVSTGAGKEAIQQAFEAGQKGGAAAEQFRANITGRSDPTEILDIAKANLDELNRIKQDEYRSGMVNVKNDKSILDFADIDKSLTNAEKKVTFNKQVVNRSAAEKINEAKGLIGNWKSLDPATYHTPEGLDALKKQIGDVLEGIPFEQKVARSSVGEIYNSVKSTIQKQAPAYANTMKAYTEATEQIREIEKALSLGKKASVDTGVRKLQSLMRDNVQTNYGQRVKLGKELESMGGQQFMPGVAGQALSSIAPRGISGALSLPTGLGGYALGGIPGAVGSAALSSPRLVGETAYGLGLTSRGAREFGTLVPPAVDPRLYNVLYQSGQMEGLLGQ